MKKILKNDIIEILMSTQFESEKLKKWFEQQVAVKKITIKMKESEKTVKKIVKTQKIIENNTEYETDFEITIINNTSV